MKRVNENVVYSKDGIGDGMESRAAMIQMLIPIALSAVNEELQAEVSRLAGSRYGRGNGSARRWGNNRGSVCLGGQKVSVKVPRVRDVVEQREIALQSYAALRDTRIIEESALGMALNGLSQRKYEKVAQIVPQTFGIKRSSVSRRFIRASANKLKEFLERDLSGEEIVSIIIDGKSFAENGIIMALGVKISGDKMALGFIESSTENCRVCRDFINGLIQRGLKIDDGILFVIDGAKGLYKGIKDALSDKAFIQRCQWHKRENVLHYLDKKHHDHFRMKLQCAYEEPDYEKAKARLLAVRKELSLINESAAKSLDEGLEETLTLHRLGMFGKLGRSFKTTNCLESLNRQLGIYTDRVSRWQNSNQRQRWIAAALLEIEPSLNKVNGYKYLKELRDVMKRGLADEKSGNAGKAA